MLLLRCTLAHLFYSSHIFFLTGSSLPFFFLTSMQCSAVQCRCAQHRCTAVSACTQPCWCAAGRNEAAAASPLPSPLLFCSSPGRTAAWRTEHSYNAAPSVLELQRCTSSARLPLQHAFHKKYIKIFHRLQHQPMRCFMYMSIYKQGQGACGLCNVHCAVAVRGVQCAVCSVRCAVCSVQCAVCGVQFAVCSVCGVRPLADVPTCPNVLPCCRAAVLSCCRG